MTLKDRGVSAECPPEYGNTIDPKYLRPKTNADHIRSMTDEELAERNVRKTKTPVTGCYDYGESYTDYYDAWETSDGAIFWTQKPAVEYELHWLKQPYKEGE